MGSLLHEHNFEHNRQNFGARRAICLALESASGVWTLQNCSARSARTRPTRERLELAAHDRLAMAGLATPTSESDSPCPPSTSSADSASAPTPAVSLLDRLKAPARSELSRKRAVQTNPPPKGKRRSSSRGNSDPKSVSPQQRLSEFPDEELSVSAGKLFCRACRECVGVIFSIFGWA